MERNKLNNPEMEIYFNFLNDMEKEFNIPISDNIKSKFNDEEETHKFTFTFDREINKEKAIDFIMDYFDLNSLDSKITFKENSITILFSF